MPRFWNFPIASVCLLFIALSMVSCRHQGAVKEEVVPLNLDEALIKKTMGRLGSGFVVWERFNNNKWQIWIKKLTGGKETRLVPDERGFDHFCPKISPDGRLLSYMSYPTGSTAYNAGKTGTLWVMQINNRKRRLIAKEARSYAEDRAVTWLDNSRLCFIDGEGYTMECNLDTGLSRRLVKRPHDSFGYLVSADLRHATTGTPEFALYDAQGEVVRNQQSMTGCQPYFTQDGRWGYWMGGAGGPLNKMNLATREAGPVLEKDDARLNGKRNYIYFPMVSPCQRLLAFAASPDRHDHFEADYDIYIAHIDPERFEVIGNPVRYTKFKGCDRYPDVFRRELPLGTHYVEGETEIEFRIPEGLEGDDWKWHITGRVEAEGRMVKQRFVELGEYWVNAKRGTELVRGYVRVRKAAPPTIERVRRDGKDGIIVSLDEPVLPEKATVSLGDSVALRDWQVTDNGFAVRVQLPAGTPDEAAVYLEGFLDLAQKPNRMERTLVKVPATAWPASEDGMVFVWENQKGRTRLPDGTPCEIKPQSLAFYDEWGAMKLRGGWFDAPGAGALISASGRRTNEITVEMIITSRVPTDGNELHPIATLANADDGGNMIIGQRGDRLVLRLRTSENDAAGSKEETQLATVGDDRSHHLVVSYRKDRLSVWMDGTQIQNRNRIRGDFSNWEDARLRFGASAGGHQPWRGSIDRVVIYERFLKGEEITQHANSSIVADSRHTPPEEWKVKAKLIETSSTPELREFQPYTEALTRHLYEVLETKKGGALPGKQIAVSHWSWLGGTPLPAQGLKRGDVVELTLNREDDHPELKSLFVKDELIEGLTAERFHDAADWDAEIVRREGGAGH
jgi:hypothetical protein